MNYTDTFLDFEEARFEGECAGCDTFAALDDVGLCDDCAAKLDRDMIRAAPIDEQIKVRNALYENAYLLDAFVAENPAQLCSDKLNIVRSWKCFVSGSFLIERFLKRRTSLLEPRGRSASTPCWV